MLENSPQYAAGMRMPGCARDAAGGWLRRCRRGGVRRRHVRRNNTGPGRWRAVTHAGAMDPAWFARHAGCLTAPWDGSPCAPARIRTFAREAGAA